ncbi:hypothetical protein JW921_01290 [Candidatus Fermentibacterales bacterium]|nr:hypothetical protein [Candidatus Fermentibacterales bacterium]
MGLQRPASSLVPVAVLAPLLVLASPCVALAADGPPGQDWNVGSLTATDAPNDRGGSVVLTWEAAGGEAIPDSLVVERSASGLAAEWTAVGCVPGIADRFVDQTASDGETYLYRLVPWFGQRAGTPTEPVEGRCSAQWLHSGRIGMLVILAILTGLIFYFIGVGQRGRELYIRQIAGLSAVDDAVGRATEMGRPILYIPGIMDMDDIQTIASMVILGRVARRTAEYGADIVVPVCRSVVMSVAQEVVKQSFTEAARPDSFKKDGIFYLTDDQFGYAAGVDGIMVRQRPAAIFLLGTFYAESLILAETGRSVGAIQISGTAMPSQLPFFIAACDYTLIGEELFAASAYLSREPKLLGSLKGQDLAKAFFMVLIVAGVLTATLGAFWAPAADLAEWLRDLVHVE